MPFTDVEICSNAMVLLGQDAVTSLSNPTSPREKACAARYPMFRLKLLASHPWNFSISKVQLSQEVATPNSQWDFQYLLPGDSLQDGVLALYQTEGTNERQLTRFISQNGRILVNATTLFADYQRDIDEAFWPAYFADYAANALAADLALSITKKPSVRDIFVRDTAQLAIMVKGLDAKAAPPNNRVRAFSLLDAHVGSVPGA